MNGTTQDPGATANDNGAPTQMPLSVTFHPDFGDVGQMLNMRGWLQRAAEAQGAKITGSGCGMGEADIDVVLEGHHFNINIRPLLRE